MSSNRFTALKETNNIFTKNKSDSNKFDSNKFDSNKFDSNKFDSNKFDSNKFIPSSTNNTLNNRWNEFGMDVDDANREREERERERNVFRNNNNRRSFFRKGTRAKTPPPKEFKLEEQDFPSL